MAPDISIQEFARIAMVSADDLPLYEKKLFPEETKEFWDGIENSDIIMQRDGLADMDFVANMIGIIGGNKQRCMTVLLSCFSYSDVNQRMFENDCLEVLKSNMSKFDKNEEQALLTRKKYAEIGIGTYFYVDKKTGLYVTKSALNQVGLDGKSYPCDKLLKSATNYTDPEIK